jgi:hypothetical protein
VRKLDTDTLPLSIVYITVNKGGRTQATSLLEDIERDDTTTFWASSYNWKA